MLKKVLLMLVVAGLAVEGWPLDFKIARVIPVGPIFGGGMLVPAQWSPDGRQLAFFSDGQLMVADSSGQSHPVANVEIAPRRFYWVTNDKIILSQRQFLSSSTTVERLEEINLRSGERNSLEEYTSVMMSKSDSAQREFEGPFVTVEGNPYYFVKVGSERSVVLAPSLSGDRASLEENHIYRTGTDAIYLVRMDFKDSTKISNKPYKPYMTLPMELSLDRSHIMFGGNIVRLADDKLTMLDTIIKELPEGTEGCGFGSPSFNPKYPEVTFRLSCDDGHSYAVRWIGVFDYSSDEFVLLDSLTNLSNCVRPVFAPDGKRIACISQGVLYIIERKF